MEIDQDYLLSKLVKEKSLEDIQIVQNLEKDVVVNCVSLSEDNMYLLCGCQNGKAFVYNLQSQLLSRINLQPAIDISAVYLFQNNNFEERKYIIFIGTTQGSFYEYNIIEQDDQFEIKSSKLPRLQQSVRNTKLQSIYYYNFILYTVAYNQIQVMNDKNVINISNFSFEINSSIFFDDCLYLGLATNQVVRIPLVQIKEEIFAQTISPDYIIYQSQVNLKNLSVYNNKEETILAVLLQSPSKGTVQFIKLETKDNKKSEQTFVSDQNINYISQIDQDYCFIQFDDFNHKIIKLDFYKQSIEILEVKTISMNIVGTLLLNNTISYPTILMIDNVSSLSQLQIGAKSNYQLPFIFWVWMRTIKDLELESLMSENYSNLIMAELKGKERGELVQSNFMFFQQHRFSRSLYYILNNNNIASNVQILILYKIKEGQFRFFQLLIRSINRMSNMKYFDISYSQFYYNQQNLKDLIETFKLRNIILDYLGLSGLNVGEKFKVNQNDPLDESELETHQIMKSIDQIAVNVSLRDNGFNDGQGRIILQRVRQIKNLKMLDISNNFFQNKTLDVLQILMQENNSFFYRFDEDFSLKMLCISFSDELQETAMKAATDYLIRKRMNNNLYIYITRKQDTLWDSSISEYFTKDLRKQKVTCMAETFTIVVECIKTGFWVIKRKGLYCFEQILCTSFFVKKYVACGYCTFLTTPIGKLCVTLFGAEPSYYEFNDRQKQLEDFLEERHKIYFGLIFIIFALYYSFVIAFPVTYDNKCAQSTWTGHFVYLIFVVLSAMAELGIANELNKFKLAHQYYMGTRWSRYCQITKDLIISQLTKFTLFTCICFIVLTASCVKNSSLYVVAIIIISINQFAEFVMIIKNVIFPYKYRRTQITQRQVLTYLSMFLSMTMIRKQLQKWPEGENNYRFFGKESGSFKVPRQVFQIITTLVLQDVPMLIIQLAHGAKNADNTTNKILLCSLLIIIIHCFYLIMKLLTITRAGLINEDVTLYEYQRQFITNFGEETGSNLKRFVKYFLQKLSNLYAKYEQRNSNILASVETDYLNYSLPINQQIQKSNQVRRVSAEDQISQKRTLVYQEDKKINFNQKVAQQQQFLNYYSEIYGKQVAFWKPSNDMPYCIVDTLLIDVPRKFFTGKDLEWVKQYDLIKNIKISSLHQEVEGFDYAYEFFKDKKELDILDLGYGSGYVSLVLLALALRRNPKMKVTLYLVDHVEEAQEKFKHLLDTKFQNFQTRAIFNFSNHDCLQGFTMFGDQKFDFIHMGFGATKWRIENQIIPLLKQHGKLFGYKLVTSALQKQFTWDNQVKQFKYNLNNNLENYGIMEPKVIQQYSNNLRFAVTDQFNYPQQLGSLQFKVQLSYECAQCYSQLEDRQKRFINPYWGECICFPCGTDKLEQQGFEKDIGKLKYKSDVIFYSGLECELQSIKSLEYLFENRIYPMGEERNRIYEIKCTSCPQKTGRGFKYRCLVCGNIFCNQCGLDFMNDQASNEDIQKCFTKHPILRIMFPATQNDDDLANGKVGNINQVPQNQGNNQSVYIQKIKRNQSYGSNIFNSSFRNLQLNRFQTQSALSPLVKQVNGSQQGNQFQFNGPQIQGKQFVTSQIQLEQIEGSDKLDESIVE